MPKKLKDTDYLSISARVRAMENGLLTRERMERMLEARSVEEAAKVLAECGYGEMNSFTPAALDERLSEARDAVYQDLQGAVPDPNVIDVFRIKYDYHNAKVLLKAEAMGLDSVRLLVGGGRYAAAALQEDFQRDDLRECSDAFRKAVAEAKETLASSGDPQRADLILDRAYFAEMSEAARATGSGFLAGYVRLLIDAANLRAAVRAHRMERGADFLAQVLVPGGNVEERSVAAAKGSELGALFRGGRLAEAAAAGAELAAPGSGHLTSFERLCDNALVDYLSAAKRIPFGEQPVIGYLAAKENEFTAVRIVMNGRMAGLDTDTIRERLRDSYV